MSLNVQRSGCSCTAPHNAPCLSESGFIHILHEEAKKRKQQGSKSTCCDMHTPMSVRSMGLTSSGHPRPGSDGPNEPLRHQRLCSAGSGQHAPRRTASRRTSMGDIMGLRSAGRERAAGAAGRRPPRGASGCTTLWAEGAVSGPRAELDIGADKRTST
jgi:hypothetical protein